MQLAAARCKSDQRAIDAAQDGDLYTVGLVGKNGSIDVLSSRFRLAERIQPSLMSELLPTRGLAREAGDLVAATELIHYRYL
jgi:hypothetical protein